EAYRGWNRASEGVQVKGGLAPDAERSEAYPRWRRSLIGLGAIGLAAGCAFVPVLVVAARMEVVSASADAPAGWLAMVLGLHGFYVRLGAMAVANAVSYPIATAGPSALDIALGVV